MASIRDLKKDFNSMVDHFINECYTQLSFSPVSNQENIIDIISDTLHLRENTIRKLNTKPVEQESSKSKKYYSNIIDEFYKEIIELTERLNSLEY